MAKNIEAILFDLDGTLIDTEPAAARAVIDCFREWGIQGRLDDAQYVTGRTWQMALEFFYSRYPIPLSREKALELMLQRYRSALDLELPLVPGGAAAVEALAPHFELALVSGSGRAEILWALDRMKIRRHFKVILGAEDYPRSKPAPDGYARALELLGKSPDQGLVFEDSQPGIESARAAGLRVVAITATNHYSQDTKLADAHIPDLSGVDAAWVRAFALKARP